MEELGRCSLGSGGAGGGGEWLGNESDEDTNGVKMWMYDSREMVLAGMKLGGDGKEILTVMTEAQD